MFQVSDGLDNLLEDLSGFHRLIVNADPISANPDKLRDDLEENKVGSTICKSRSLSAKLF